MKKTIVFIGILLSLTAVAQNKNVVEIKFKVFGKCDMCETRIESALDVSGIKFADWNIETKQCKVVYNKKKITEEQIHKLLAEAGHDTQELTASQKAYDQLHRCCKYSRKKEDNE